MARESAIDKLTPEHKQQLDDKLFDNGFNGYQDLAGWLQNLGYEISKSSVHRYGKKLENKLAAAKAATDMAMHFAENAADDTGALSNATISLMQTELFNTLVALKELEDGQPTEERLLLLAKISKPFSELTRASITQKKFESEVKEKARAELLAEQAEKLEEHVQAGGLGAEQVDFWRREFLGVKSGVKSEVKK